MHRTPSRTLATIVAAALIAIVPGCGALPREKAVPAGAEDRAFVPGLDPGIRSWGGESNPAFNRLLLASVEREREELARQGLSGQLPRADFLAISGGGADGAFGAGMLCAWTDLGTRPAFKAVTGISTGALTAPFVFAGPEYDGVLRELYTGTSTQDILVERGLVGGFLSDAMADTTPLWKLMSRHVDGKLMDAIAAEHRKGRLLVIGTTNLDARRAVLWNVGEIAASGDPGALDLVRKILIASAAIPGAFPPVLIDVEADGERYQEMHVDGGAMTQVFLYPASLHLRERARAEGITRERRAYIIRNARLDPDWSQVDRRTMSIAGRAISALIATQGLGDLYRLYLDCQRDGVDYNVAYIPPDFDVTAEEAFDPTYMKALFERGYALTRSASPWHKFPPGFDAPIEMPSEGPVIGGSGPIERVSPGDRRDLRSRLNRGIRTESVHDGRKVAAGGGDDRDPPQQRNEPAPIPLGVRSQNRVHRNRERPGARRGNGRFAPVRLGLPGALREARAHRPPPRGLPVGFSRGVPVNKPVGLV